MYRTYGKVAFFVLLGAWLLTLGGFPGLLVLSYLVVGHFSGGILLLDIAWIVLGLSLWSGGRASSAQELAHSEP